MQKGALVSGRTQQLPFFVRSQDQLTALQAAAESLQDKALQGMVVQGVAWHHAAMEPQDRATIEQLFLQRHVMFLAATATLAQVHRPKQISVCQCLRAPSALLPSASCPTSSGPVLQNRWPMFLLISARERLLHPSYLSLGHLCLAKISRTDGSGQVSCMVLLLLLLYRLLASTILCKQLHVTGTSA